MQPLKIYKLFICCSTPETIACLDFKRSKSTFYGTFSDLLKLLYSIMYIDMKQEVWWVYSLIKIVMIYKVQE